MPSGTLIIQTSTARESLPVAGANVTVSTVGTADAPPQLLFSGTTDRSGQTVPITLAAPPRAGSLHPGGPLPFGVYTVTVEAPGFVPISRVNVPIFDGVASTLPVFLLPLAEGQSVPEGVEIETIPSPPIAGSGS